MRVGGKIGAMVSKKRFNPKKIEAKWKKDWEDNSVFEVNMEKAEKPFYNLMMFPYPSAEGLHVGNMYAFCGTDVYGRFTRMQGKDVLEPIGLDGFGIHSENYAIKVGKHPAEQAEISQENFYRQLSMIGNGFAWERRLETYNPEYYRWTQWLFIQMFKHGLAYKKSSFVNWCPQCKTVLADEQVENGKCERCKNEVMRKELKTWHFKITEYAERLLSNIDGKKGKRKQKMEPVDEEWKASRDGLRWSEKIKIAQRQWIGKKEGVKVSFGLNNVPGQEDGKHKADVFTTRLDTIFGVSFLVVAPEVAKSWMEVGWKAEKEVEEYVEKALNKTEQERKEGEKDKSGVKTSLMAVNPANNAEISVWVADYVLMEVGTGVVMGVPAHDSRDFDFAKKYNLDVIEVVEGGKTGEVYEGKGKLINSGKYDGMENKEAAEKILADAVADGWAEKTVNYHLRDWVVSRQRYWGPPIPMVECDKCGWQAIEESELPLKLPEIEDFKPKGDGSSPLSNAPEEWKIAKCPKCGGEARRELDVSDTFLDSSWYFLAYPHMKEGKWVEYEDSKAGEPFSKQILRKWLPVDAYIGGAEHAVLHLLYARFVTQALHDWGYLSFEEPFPFLFGHGLIIKDGAKMSKSRGNVINPDEYIEKFGADALRLYLMFLGSFEMGGDFRDTGMEAMRKWVERVYELVLDETKMGEESSDKVLKKLNKTIKKVGRDMRRFSFNTAIAAMMELVNEWKVEGEVLAESDARKFVQLLAPLAPFVSEELWSQLGGTGSVHVSSWPEFDEELVLEKIVEIPVQVNGKVRGVVEVSRDEAEREEIVVKKALMNESVKKWVGEAEVKPIFVPGRLVNLVVG